MTNTKELRKTFKWDLIYSVVWIAIVYVLAMSGMFSGLIPETDLPFYYSLTIIALIAMFATYAIRRFMMKRKME